VHVSVGLGEDERLCLLVIIGVREDGRKELLAVEDGHRESTDSWAEVLRDLKARGMSEPKLVTADGALGLWGALRDVFPAAREQHWVHKTANILDALPERMYPLARRLLFEVERAPTRQDANRAIDEFVCEFESKWPKAAEKLTKDREPLLAYFDFPAEQWRHLRTTDENVKGRGGRVGRFSGDESVAVGSRRAADRLLWLRFWRRRARRADFGRAEASSLGDVVRGRLSAGVTLWCGRGRPRSEAQDLGLRPAAQPAPHRGP
jgi:transposase-like protein